MATNKPTYATTSDLRDIYPNIDKYDTKKPVYGWQTAITNWYDSDLDLYYANNSGLVNSLFWNGAKTNKIAYNTTETTKVDGAFTSNATTFYVDAGHGLGANDIIKIDNEYLRIVGVSDDTIAVSTPSVSRGLFDTSANAHANDTSVYKIIDASVDVGDNESQGEDALLFVYDSDLDLCIAVSGNDPKDNLLESGEDWTTHKTDLLYKASRYFDSYVDASLPAKMSKNDEGEFPYLVIRTTAQICAYFLISAHDPENEDALRIKAEYEEILEKLINGQVKLDYEKSADSSKGILRDITYTGAIRPVDTRGSWGGTYDLVKVKIIDAGAMGTATYSVWVKDGDKLGVNEGTQVITAQKINGDYQSLAGGLQIRFAGSAKDSTAAANDEWEVEVHGRGEVVDNPVVRSVKMTRGWSTNRFR